MFQNGTTYGKAGPWQPTFHPYEAVDDISCYQARGAMLLGPP
jgi:hypothetical protein